MSLLFAVAATSWATLITDDFNRPNTEGSSDTSLIGSAWKQESVNNEWLVNALTLASHTVENPGAIYNDSLTTTSGNGSSFKLQMDVRAQANAIWCGMAFNYQDKDNFYILRFKGGYDDWQLLRNVGGSLGLIKSGHATQPFTFHSNFYTLTVDSDTLYDFDFTITEQGSSTIINSVTNGVDANANFTDGYAAAYTSNTGYSTKFDNFSLEVIPEPTTLGLMGVVGAASIFIRKRFMS